MSSEPKPPPPEPQVETGETGAMPGSEPGRDRSASDDLAAGLSLMMRAARKALSGVEPGIEGLGKRAAQTIENLDRRRVTELGRKAAENLDPRKIEQVAEEAGRELLGVINRVADRVDEMLGTRPPGSAPSDSASGSEPRSRAEPGTESSGEPKPRIRVDDGS